MLGYVYRVDIHEASGAMAKNEQDAEFTAFVRDARSGLARIAFLMSRDWHQAEDVVQTVLARAYPRWTQICREGDPFAYVRRGVLHALIDEKRRAHRRREQAVAEPPDDVGEPSGRPDHTDGSLSRALQNLPGRQRAVVVLRYVEDWSISEVANELGITDGTVKSQAARGLTTLRQALTKSSINEACVRGGSND